MKERVIKISILIALIILCIIQISIVWLGDMSSPNFLDTKTVTTEETGIPPKNIWVNLALAYKISENNREYDYLIHELFGELRNQKRALKFEAETEMSYADLIGKQGILYEYAVPLTLEEIIGNKIPKYDEQIVAEQLFVDLSSNNENKVVIYLIAAKGNKIHKAILYTSLMGHSKVMSSLSNEEVAKKLTSYQPSITSFERHGNVEGNVFLPEISEAKPLTYQKLMITNTLEAMEKEDKMDLLEEYVTSFFTNPLLKQIDEKSDGTIIFSENLRAIVKYNPIGTMEFNILTPNEENRLTQFERLQKVTQFIDSCTAIPEYLKKGLYLTGIRRREGQEYIYHFNYKYNGFQIQMKEEVKKQLGLDSTLELTIKDNQVIKGKWILLDIKTVGYQGTVAEDITRSYGEIFDAMNNMGVKKGAGTLKLSNLECSYIVNQLESDLEFDWLVTYGNKWYYP